MIVKRFIMTLILLLAGVVMALCVLRAFWQHQAGNRIRIKSAGGIDGSSRGAFKPS